MTKFHMTKMTAKRTTAIVGVVFPSRCRAVADVAAVGLALCCAAWARQPEPLATQTATPPQAVWTLTSGAPKGLLTAYEGERHDRFISRARSGEIDIVFFGSTETEMWLWRERGLSVWDRTFGTRKAADFGTQGTRSSSLQWRMRNGELDGYTAKLVVLQAQIGGFDDYVPQYSAIIAEIRARQPQAKILLFGIFPRNRARKWSQANAALYALGDNENVFFIDIGDRFFRPDGSFNNEMWNYAGPDVGMQKRAFEVWAEELQPWLNRFVR